MAPVPTPAHTDLDRPLIASNVRRARLNQALSQSELAERAGIDLASVYRVEKGVSTRTATIKKIAKGLDIMFEDLLIKKSVPDPTLHFAVHRAAVAKWYAAEDRRHRVPLDQEELCQDEAERIRLGRLGLVPLFMCPPTIIPDNGPGIVLLELYEEIVEPFNAAFYEDGAIYVLRGAVSVTIVDVASELAEGDWIAFKTKDLTRMAVLSPHEAAKVLWIGATRVAKKR
jgi:transcriptional regulator with XRE-family HTH domain